jgi:uncharacterized protein Yka (UPF0111/DUF47 family)
VNYERVFLPEDMDAELRKLWENTSFLSKEIESSMDNLKDLTENNKPRAVRVLDDAIENFNLLLKYLKDIITMEMERSTDDNRSNRVSSASKAIELVTNQVGKCKSLKDTIVTELRDIVHGRVYHANRKPIDYIRENLIMDFYHDYGNYIRSSDDEYYY